jgi:hypothetical protein
VHNRRDQPPEYDRISEGSTAVVSTTAKNAKRYTNARARGLQLNCYIALSAAVLFAAFMTMSLSGSWPQIFSFQWIFARGIVAIALAALAGLTLAARLEAKALAVPDTADCNGCLTVEEIDAEAARVRAEEIIWHPVTPVTTPTYTEPHPALPAAPMPSLPAVEEPAMQVDARVEVAYTGETCHECEMVHPPQFVVIEDEAVALAAGRWSS